MRLNSIVNKEVKIIELLPIHTKQIHLQKLLKIILGGLLNKTFIAFQFARNENIDMCKN